MGMPHMGMRLHMARCMERLEGVARRTAVIGAEAKENEKTRWQGHRAGCVLAFVLRGCNRRQMTTGLRLSERSIGWAPREVKWGGAAIGAKGTRERCAK